MAPPRIYPGRLQRHAAPRQQEPWAAPLVEEVRKRALLGKEVQGPPFAPATVLVPRQGLLPECRACGSRTCGPDISTHVVQDNSRMHLRLDTHMCSWSQNAVIKTQAEISVNCPSVGNAAGIYGGGGGTISTDATSAYKGGNGAVLVPNSGGVSPF